MNPWAIGAAAVVLWTCAVAYFASEYGEGKAAEACQEERDFAQSERKKLEEGHAEQARKLEEEQRHDRNLIGTLRTELRGLAARKPVACRIGPERMQLWNDANAGRAHVPGEPAGTVPGNVPPADH